MRAEIVRAGALRPEDIIAYGKHILMVGEVDIDSTPGVALVQIEGHVNKVAFNFDDWVPRLLPEPVKEREFWRVNHANGYIEECESRDDAIESVQIIDEPGKSATVEHVRETVLSRDEVKPEN